MDEPSSQELVQQDAFVVRGEDVEHAWAAIESQDPYLLPPEADKEVKSVEGHSGFIRSVMRGANVERLGQAVRVGLSEETPGDWAAAQLIVRPAAQTALRHGLEEFAKGPKLSDFGHLRVRKVFEGMHRRRAAMRMLPRQRRP